MTRSHHASRLHSNKIMCLQQQNATARLITGTRPRDHITPVLRELHWLPIRERVLFKVACLVRQLPSGQTPLYLADDCCLVSYSTWQSLRSADVPTCVVPPMLNRTCAAAGPHLWNSLLVCSCAIQTPPTNCLSTAEGTSFSGSMNTAPCDF